MSKVPAKWDATKIQPQHGKSVVITGANSGIGYVTALELARHGANVVLACRSGDKGRAAVQQIQAEINGTPGAGRVEFRQLDVSSLASVSAFADEYKQTHTALDLLINNAGIFQVPFSLTVDGYENQFATNHLGHFALTAQLLELLKQSKSARIVNISSVLHRDAKMNYEELMTPIKELYDMHLVYANTKLYNLLFTYEMNRRFRAAGITNVIATTAHPGVTITTGVETMIENASWLKRQVLKLVRALPITQAPEFGALPPLYAATATGIKADDYFGPDGFRQMTGYPTLEDPSADSKSPEHARKLWSESERLAKLSFRI